MDSVQRAQAPNGYNLDRGGGGRNDYRALTDTEIDEIVDLLVNTNETLQAIAARYGVHHKTIENVNRGRGYMRRPNIDNYPLRKSGKIRVAQAKEMLINELGMTIKQIAEKLGMSEGWVAGINSGKFARDETSVYPLRKGSRCKTYGS